MGGGGQSLTLNDRSRIIIAYTRGYNFLAIHYNNYIVVREGKY
jgi:hypothetical protein